jgi:hypothetical protein
MIIHYGVDMTFMNPWVTTMRSYSNSRLFLSAENGYSRRLGFSMVGTPIIIAEDPPELLVIPAKAGIYCAIGAVLRRCDEAGDAADTVNRRDPSTVCRATYGRRS